LDNGAIFDLACHALAVICAAINQKTTCSATDLSNIIKSSKIRTKATQVDDSPISGETFALISFTINDGINVSIEVGYHPSNTLHKSMELHGIKGTIKLDFITDQFTISDTQDKLLKRGILFTNPVEIYLEGLLRGKSDPLLLPGVLDHEAALAILSILDIAKRDAKDDTTK
jgi:predicted dehydrogenase